MPAVAGRKAQDGAVPIAETMVGAPIKPDSAIILVHALASLRNLAPCPKVDAMLREAVRAAAV